MVSPGKRSDRAIPTPGIAFKPAQWLEWRFGDVWSRRSWVSTCTRFCSTSIIKLGLKMWGWNRQILLPLRWNRRKPTRCKSPQACGRFGGYKRFAGLIRNYFFLNVQQPLVGFWLCYCSAGNSWAEPVWMCSQWYVIPMPLRRDSLLSRPIFG